MFLPEEYYGYYYQVNNSIPWPKNSSLVFHIKLFMIRGNRQPGWILSKHRVPNGQRRIVSHFAVSRLPRAAQIWHRGTPKCGDNL